MNAKQALKNLLGELPLTVETYWLLRKSGRPLRDHYKFPALTRILPKSAAVAAAMAPKASPGKRIFIFATLHYWVEHTALMGLALASQGHRVELAYLPYEDWRHPVSRFDLRRRDLYTRDVLNKAGGMLKAVSLLKMRPVRSFPAALQKAVEETALFDTQYTLQAEEIDFQHPLYRLRLERDRAAASAVLVYLQKNRPDVVIVPNGMVLEFGAVYAAARTLDIPTVTYEFGEQNNRIWIAQNAQIMRHETDALWAARKDIPLTEEQRAWLSSFLASRQTAQRDDSFARLWQEIAKQGGKRVRAELELDDRPIVLFTTNVLGDSLTLGRQLLGSTMSEWITRLVRYFATRRDVQLVIRIHPGEKRVRGPSVAGVIHQALPQLPENIHLIKPEAKVNTYDLMEITSLGLVYTSTSGLEMATRGLPVMTAGKAHYRGRSFTTDANTYDEYFAALDRLLADLPGHRLTPAQIDLAWNYAYRFFHDFPRPFPWHILHIAENIRERPVEDVLSETGLAQYAVTLRQLAGEPLDWSNKE